MTFILLYCYTVIFGGWILNLLHAPASLGFSLLQLIDFLPFIYFIVKFKLKDSWCGLPNSVGFWVLAFGFLLLSCFTAVCHSSSILPSLMHFGTFFRYAPLAVVITRLKQDSNNIKIWKKHFLIISYILISIGFIEIFGGGSIKHYFVPLTKEYSSVTAALGSEDLCTFGIFANTVDYAYFLVLSYVVISNINNKKHPFILFLIYLIPLYYTGSKAALIIFLICVIFRMDSLKTARNCFIVLIFSVSFYLIYEYWDLFYWTVFIDSRASRLGYLIFTLPDFIKEISLDTFTGVSPNREIAYQKINSYPNAPAMTWNVDAMTSFEDEFYVALPVYYGLIGFALIVTIYWRMMHTLMKAKWCDSKFNYHTIVKCFCLILVVAPLFNQIIILKPFSLFFWAWTGILITRIKKSKCEYL